MLDHSKLRFARVAGRPRVGLTGSSGIVLLLPALLALAPLAASQPVDETPPAAATPESLVQAVPDETATETTVQTAPDEAAAEPVTQTAPGEAQDRPIEAAELESFVDGFMAAYLEEANVAGATLSVVRDGEILLAKGYGYADVAAGSLVSAERTLFRIGSVSKLFIWTAVMQLVERGQLDLQADINDYLRDIEIPPTHILPVTMEHLMTHTPGFEDHVIGLFGRGPESLRPLGELLREQLPARVRPAGGLASYSNHGSALAMYIVQQVSGAAWQQYVQDEILTPLGMEATTFAQPVPSGLEADLSKGYRHESGEFREQPFEYVPLAPAGAVSSTAADMARFMLCHLQLGRLGEVRILQEKTARLMQSELFRQAPGVNAMAHGLMEMNQNGQRALGHGGDTLWFHTVLGFFPEHGLGLFASFNSADGRPGRLFEAFADRYFPEEKTTPAAAVGGGVAKFLGSYRVNRFSHTTLAKLSAAVQTAEIEDSGDGGLVSRAQRKTRWSRTGALEFRERDGDRILAFREAADGTITHAFLGDLPFLALERIPDSENPKLHLRLLIVLLILFLAVVLHLPLSALMRWRRKGTTAPAARLPLVARLLAWTTALGLLAFAVGLGVVMSNRMEVAFGIPPSLQALLWLPLVGGGLAVCALLYAGLIWKTGRGRFLSRCVYSLVMAFFVFGWQLSVWNLLGFRY